MIHPRFATTRYLFAVDRVGQGLIDRRIVDKCHLLLDYFRLTVNNLVHLDCIQAVVCNQDLDGAQCRQDVRVMVDMASKAT